MCCIICVTLIVVVYLCNTYVINIIYSFRCLDSDVLFLLSSLSFYSLSLSFLLAMRFPGDRKLGRYSGIRALG